ncbi:MAG: DNA repair protein RecN [Actinobacteria bacterium]|nr:DNA repair protein RecN [Actinomycetota bacterium]
MLTDLAVESLGVIERAELSLEPGCSALTGETGAGKTLVVAALALLLGGRADRALVRTGAKEARLEARFTVPPSHPAAAYAGEHGLIDAGGEGEVEIIVARTVPSGGGAGRCRVNGRLATVATLGELGGTLAEISGQHEHQRLSRSAHQRLLLDAYAGPEALDLAERVAEAVRRAAAAERTYQDLVAGERARRRELDVLDFEIAELSAAHLEPGQSAHLTEEAARLDGAEAIAAALNAGIEALGGEGGAEEAVGLALGSVRSAAAKDPVLESQAARLESAAYELGDIAAELAARIVEPDASALEAVRERLAEIRRLERKYGSGETEMLAYLERAAERRADLEAMDAGIERFERERTEHAAEARALAGRLSEMRRIAAGRLADSMTERLAGLALANARFEARLRPVEIYEGGAESVDFVVATAPGEAPKPITKIASGGELSRISLALRLLTTSGAVGTMVFDEVDAGVGGEAAQAVGRALAGLARSSGAQVIVVTHLPQVAAQAEGHYRVTKATGRNLSEAIVERVDGERRIAELSRMLAGLPKSDRAREHAQELLELAAEP